MKLTDIVAPGAIITQLASQDRDGAVAQLVDALISVGAAPAAQREEMIQRVLERETRSSTGFGRGVAVPHMKHRLIRRTAAAIGLSTTGVDFASLDKQPVYSIFLLISPEDRPEDHLLAMEVIFKNLSKDTFRRFLRQAATPEEVQALLDEADNQQIGG
jgi:mannitol/fructose-specific phosphotransferase system IIA component (Ntr-type)